jgi:iron complex outermembrane recepter protein
MKNYYTMRNFIGGSILAILQLNVAHAQGIPDAETTSVTEENTPGIQDIIVQGRRKSELQQSVPLAISSVSSSRLADAAVTSIEDLQRLVPSLKVQVGSTGQIDFTIRGSFSGYGVDPAVVTYIDDVPMDSRTIVYSTFDLESVQQLKGPQGTLFGRNSTGGAVLFFSKKPVMDQFGGYANIRYGNLNEMRAESALNIPIATGLAFRLSGEVEKRDGQLQSVTAPSLDYDNRNNYALRASLLWQPGDTFENYTQATHYRVRENRYPQVIDSLQTPCSGPFTPALACLYQPPFNGFLGTDDYLTPYLQQLTLPSNKTVAADPTYDYVDRDSITNTLTLNLGGVSLRNISYYGDVNLLWSRDFDGTVARVIDSRYTDNIKTFYSETQIFGKVLNDRLDWRVGGVYSQDKGNQNQVSVTFPSPLTLLTSPQTTRSITNFKSSALFAQATYDLSDFLKGVSVTAGYRHTWDDRTLSSTVYGGVSGTVCQLQVLPVPASGAQVFPGTDLATCTRTLKKKFNDSNYNFSIDWKPTKNLLLYATTRKGYKTGSFNTLVTDPNLAGYDPEVIKDVELGLKADWKVGAIPVRTNIALFQSKYTNIQTSTVALTNAGGVVVIVLNRDPVTGLSSKATIKGFEAEVTVAPTRWLQLSGFYSKVDGKYDRFIDPSNRVDVSGQKISNLFPASYGITAQADIPLGGSIESLGVTASYFRTSQPTRNAVSTTSNPNQESLDGRIALRHMFHSDMELAFFGKNVTNERKCGINPLVQGALTHSCNQPRTYGLDLTFHFSQ